MESTLVDGFSAAVRALSFIALFQAAGIATFIAIFGRRLPVTLKGTQRIGVASALVAVLFAAAHYLLEAARMGGELAGAMDPGLQSLVLHSSTAAAFGARVAGLVLIILALRLNGRPSNALVAAGIVLVTLSFTLVGHTASDPQRTLLRALLLAHLIIVVFWFGALVPLYRASVGESTSTAGETTEAFSRLAVWIVPMLFIAGALLAALLLPSIAALRTAYGELLLVKIGGFGVLMLLGALNKWRLGPALARGDVGAAPALRRTLALEYAVIAGILGVTAILTSFYSPH